MTVKSIVRVAPHAKAHKHRFRSRLWVTCESDPAPGKSRQSMINAIRKLLVANTDALGLPSDTRFYYSKNAGDGDATLPGFILDRSATDADGKVVELYVTFA